MFIFMVNIFTLLMLSVKCGSQFTDPNIFLNFTNNNYNISRMLSSMSPYTMLNMKTMTNHCVPNTFLRSDPNEYYMPSRAWLLTRHGEKNPSEKIINDISTKLVNFQNILKQLYGNKTHSNYTSLSKKDKKIIDSISKWENFLNGAEHKTLNDYGRISIASLGNRLNTKLKKLTEKLRASEIEVLTAVEDRCFFTAGIFLSEFFEGNLADIEITKNEENDDRLKLMKPKDEVMIEPYNNGNLVLVEDYYFDNYCRDIKYKIGNLLFPAHIESHDVYRNNVTDEIVKIIYYACAYGFNYKKKNEQPAINWCSVFDFYDLKKMENMYDLQYFNKNGYYLENNRNMGKKIVEDIVRFIEYPDDKKFKLFVGHTANILSVITTLNMFKDEQDITAENIDQMNNRKWRTSFIVPSGSNILVVVYDIDSDEYVSIYLNEVPIEMVLDNGQLCVTCPKNMVIDLIYSLL